MSENLKKRLRILTDVQETMLTLIVHECNASSKGDGRKHGGACARECGIMKVAEKRGCPEVQDGHAYSADSAEGVKAVPWGTRGRFTGRIHTGHAATVVFYNSCGPLQQLRSGVQAR